MGKVRLLLLCALLVIGRAEGQELKLMALIGDSLISKQMSKTPLWGWDKAGSVIKAVPSWDHHAVETNAAKAGKWQFIPETTAAEEGAFSQDLPIIPVPAQVNAVAPGHITITSKTSLVFEIPLERSALYLGNYCRDVYRLNLCVRPSTGKKSAKNRISLEFDSTMVPGQYTLRISDKEIRIRGSADGVFYGIQSLIQLLPVTVPDRADKLEVPFVDIADMPRFEYRGMLLDVGRHFFGVGFLKKCIDYAAYHKMNIFHLHLTDDQGWRIEIKRYPMLNQIGSWRNGTMIGLYPGTGNDSIRHGGYYTQDELKELVAYARDRFITLIPEIEMPGHALAALASYPYLGCTGGPYRVKESWGYSGDVFCAGKESTFEFIQHVLDEVMEIFPSKYIHIGGDECPKERWQQCAACQAKIKEKGLADEQALQHYFVTRIQQYLSAKGRTIIGWDEILEGGTAPDAVIMSWRGDGEQGCLNAVRAKRHVILAPSYGFYLDYPQTSTEDSLAANWGGVTSVRKTYQYEPANKKLTPADIPWILGGQANVWTEYMSNESKVEYMIFPRLSAVSEVLWSPMELRSWENFKNRLDFQYKRYRLWGAVFNPADPDLE